MQLIFPLIKQLNKLDCAPACIMMLMKYYKLNDNISFQRLRELCKTDRNGTDLLNLKKTLETLQIEAKRCFLSMEELAVISTPAILFVNGNHYVILYKVRKNIFYIADPARGKYSCKANELKQKWVIKEGIGVLLKTKKTNTKVTQEKSPSNELDGLTLKILYKKMLSFKKGIRHIIILISLTSLIQLIVPYLTQSIVDVGINNQNIEFVYIILLAQFMLFLGSTSVNFITGWIILHIGLNINLKISNLFTKSIINKKPSYFENKKEGDFLQRINDNNRVESFLTKTTLTLLTSILNIVLFGAMLMFYNFNIFLVFAISTGMSIVWIYFFMKKRKQLDNNRFRNSSKSKTELLEIINGVVDIKLNNIKEQRLLKWQKLQEEFLSIRMKLLEWGQIQAGGARGLNQLKNIIITFLSAKAVISGYMTLGEMLAVQFIIGQLNSPTRDIVNFAHQYQDAQLSISRLSDVIQNSQENTESSLIELKKDVRGDIIFENVFFIVDNKNIVDNMNLLIPYGSKIGIVGESGSGKTTMLKLLLNLNSVTSGDIRINNDRVENIDSSNFSFVFQDSYIFSASILYNITLDLDRNKTDSLRLEQIIKSCLLGKLIESLSNGGETKIGQGGKVLSRGQEQRILIARALYKKSNYLILDEFTNSLDNKTKKIIIRNIYNQFSDKTIISVAHKLEDITHVDRILVIENGEIIEEGNHENLIAQKKEYYTLFNS